MALWIFLLIVVAVAFVFIHAFLLPALFLKVKYDYTVIPDRGIKVIDGEDGREIVCEPDKNYLKYIKKYVIFEKNGKKFFVCKLADFVKYIDMDIVLFDETGNSFKAVDVKELIKERGVTDITPLPDKTAYVTIVLNAVNDEKFTSKATKGVLLKGVFLDIAFGALTEVVAVLLTKILVGKLWGEIYFESFLMRPSTWLLTALVCVALIAINTIFTFMLVLFRRRKSKGVELNA